IEWPDRRLSFVLLASFCDTSTIVSSAFLRESKRGVERRQGLTEEHSPLYSRAERGIEYEGQNLGQQPTGDSGSPHPSEQDALGSESQPVRRAYIVFAHFLEGMQTRPCHWAAAKKWIQHLSRDRRGCERYIDPDGSGWTHRVGRISDQYQTVA